MEIYLNGQARQIETGATLLELVEQLGYTGKRIAVERNGDIVPKSQHGQARLDPGDRLEIVIAVGGG